MYVYTSIWCLNIKKEQKNSFRLLALSVSIFLLLLPQNRKRNYLNLIKFKWKQILNFQLNEKKIKTQNTSKNINLSKMTKNKIRVKFQRNTKQKTKNTTYTLLYHFNCNLIIVKRPSLVSNVGKAKWFLHIFLIHIYLNYYSLLINYILFLNKKTKQKQTKTNCYFTHLNNATTRNGACVLLIA